MSPGAAAYRDYDDYRRMTLINEAAQLGVELVALDPVDYPGMYFSYRPANADWPEIHVTRYPYDWRILVVEIPAVTYDREWRYAMPGHTFADVIHALGHWRGDPDGEPHGFTWSWDWRASAATG